MTSLGRSWSDETVAEARRLRAEGLSYKVIGARLGVPYDTLLDWLSRGMRAGAMPAADYRASAIKALRNDGAGFITALMLTHGQELAEALAADLQAYESWRCSSVLMKALREYTKTYINNEVVNDT